MKVQMLQNEVNLKKHENLALATVCLSISTNLQIYVRSAESAKAAWENLSKHFEQKSLSKKFCIVESCIQHGWKEEPHKLYQNSFRTLGSRGRPCARRRSCNNLNKQSTR